MKSRDQPDDVPIYVLIMNESARAFSLLRLFSVSAKIVHIVSNFFDTMPTIGEYNADSNTMLRPETIHSCIFSSPLSHRNSLFWTLNTGILPLRKSLTSIDLYRRHTKNHILSSHDYNTYCKICKNLQSSPLCSCRSSNSNTNNNNNDETSENSENAGNLNASSATKSKRPSPWPPDSQSGSAQTHRVSEKDNPLPQTIQYDHELNNDNATHLNNVTVAHTVENDIDEIVEIMFANKTFQINKSNQQNLCVVNLSNRVLTQTEIDILEKGLKFCPTPGEPNMYEIHKDLRTFFRRMRLKAHFTEDPDLQPPPSQNNSILNFVTRGTPQGAPDINLSKFKPKSDWEPKDEHKDPVLETFFKCVQNDIGYFTQREARVKNITKSEKEAIESLSKDPNIVIKKADKGTAVVIMNTTDYINEANRQLSDTNFYLKQSHDLTETHSAKITEFLESMLESGEIDQKIFDAIKPNKARTARFYFLPKIHKPIVKGRPIISGNNCPTESISAFVDEHLKPFVKQVPSYVRDTTDFIKKVEGFHSNRDYYLVTMDVTSLYTNIPNHEGITAVYRTLLQKGYQGQVELNSIIQLLKFVLHMNNFTFNGEEFLQVGGTAMGTRLAPSYANLFMGYLESKMLAGAPYKPSLYLRFIGHQFIGHMNQYHPTIKFTAEYSRDKVSFLDTWVKISNDGKIYTDLYSKPTDTHNYLHFSSCHPSHCKTGGPYGEFLRLRRNCSNMNDFLKHANERKLDYLRRGYPLDLIEESINKATNQNRERLLNPPHKSGTKKVNRVPLVITYNPANPNFMKTIKKYWPLLDLSKKCKLAFTEPPLIAYRRNKNLNDKLVRASAPTTKQPNNQAPVYRCLSKTLFCIYCPKKDMPDQYTSTHTGRSYTGPTNYKCGVRNVIYLITCRKCQKQYVGQTYRPYKERISEHLSYARRKKMDTATGKHFSLPGHTHFDINHRVISILGGAITKNNPKLLELEEMLIERLRTMEPIGLNDKNSQRV